MSPEAQGIAQPAQTSLLRKTMYFLAALVVARFVLEVVSVPTDVTRWLSSTVGLFLAGIYYASVAPLREGVKKVYQVVLPAVVLAVWTGAWVILATILAAVFRLRLSHFAETEDYGNWGHLGRHIMGHLVETGLFVVVVFILMAVVHVLWRWPITVGPGAILGGIVIMRFWVEAMGVEAWRAAAWSSTVGVLIGAFYLGGIGPRLGLQTGRQLLAPALVLGWTWRLWVFIATLMSAFSPFYKTHFFDPSQGRVAVRLAQFLAASVVEGFIAGLIVWGIATWIACATRPRAEV